MNGVKETGKEGKIVMIGYDAGKQLKDEIKAGIVAGAISAGSGRHRLQVRRGRGEGDQGRDRCRRSIDTGFKWYDKTNMDEPEMQPLLYD